MCQGLRKAVVHRRVHGVPVLPYGGAEVPLPGNPCLTQYTGIGRPFCASAKYRAGISGKLLVNLLERTGRRLARKIGACRVVDLVRAAALGNRNWSRWVCAAISRFRSRHLQRKSQFPAGFCSCSSRHLLPGRFRSEYDRDVSRLHGADGNRDFRWRWRERNREIVAQTQRNQFRSPRLTTRDKVDNTPRADFAGQAATCSLEQIHH